jgi:DNA-binding transcriptional regulator LsrR (DeoR family)
MTMISTSRIAREVYVNGLSQEEVANLLGISPRTVRQHLKKARDSKMINVFIAPQIDHQELTNLAIELKAQFSLKEAVIVQGLDEVMDLENNPEKEAVLLSCCFTAAQYLASSLKDGDIVAIPWGRVASYIAGSIVPRRKLPNLTVIPMVGVMDVDSNRYEANIIAARMGSLFGGKHLMLAAPAVVEKQHYKTIVEIPLVKRVLRKLDEANVVVTTIAAPNAQTSTVVKKGLASKAEVEQLINLGAVGEIASHWWFDKHGELVQRSRALSIGLGLDGLRRVIQNEGKVIAVVGASGERSKPTWVALDQGLVNVLITDHVSARKLLSYP